MILSIPLASNPKISMDFTNLTREQNQFLQKVVGQAIYYAQDKFFTQGLDFNFLQMLKVFLKYFISCLGMCKNDILREVLQLLIPDDDRQYFMNAIVNMVNNYNLAGKILSLRDQEQKAEYYLHKIKCLQYICKMQEQKMQVLSNKLFLDGFQNVTIRFARIQQIQKRKYINQVKTYLKRFRNQQLWKQYIKLIQECRFDKYNIDQLYQTLKEQNSLDHKQKTIVRVYDVCVNGGQYLRDHLISKYNGYQFIQYLLTLSTNQFQDKFQVYDDIGIDIFVKLLNERRVRSLSELKMKTRIAMHLELNNVYIKFSDDFKLEEISNEDIVDMLDSVENRVQLIGGSISFIIIRRLSTNMVFKSIITRDNQQQIETLLKQCVNGELHDIIIVSGYKYEYLGDIRIRYLNYSKYNGKIEITLHHPISLISGSLENVKIANISQCVNLKNIYSYGNAYKKQDISSLYDLTIIYSDHDTYQSSSTCLLNDLFENNKLEYIRIKDENNTQFPILLSQNVKNLRFIDVLVARIGIEYFGDSLNRLFQLFEKKYLDQDQAYQDINFFDHQWVQEQVGIDSYIKWQQLTLSRNVFDPYNYKYRLLDIITSQYKPYCQQEMLNNLINDVAQYRKIRQQGDEQLNQAIDVYSLIQFRNYIIYGKECNIDAKTQFIGHLYDIYREDVQIKYNVLKLAQYLVTIDSQTFINEFCDNNEELRQMAQWMAQSAINGKIQSTKQLRCALLICKQLEQKTVYIKFDNDFKLDDVPDEILVRLFDNIENRLQVIRGYGCNFIVIHRVSDNMIIKSMIDYSDNSQEQIEDMLKQCSNEDLYDVIIVGKKQENLGNIKIRYLNYYNEYADNIQITLTCPEALVSLSSWQTKITNMNKCINLKNLYSESNIYTKQDISFLRNLKRLCSDRDVYRASATCFLYDLFQENKLEYVCIINFESDSNILGHLTLSQNIERLRYLWIYQYGAIYNIRLDIFDQVPKSLSVYDVEARYDILQLYGTLTGLPEKLEEVEKKLLHEIKNNK